MISLTCFYRYKPHLQLLGNYDSGFLCRIPSSPDSSNPQGGSASYVKVSPKRTQKPNPLISSFETDHAAWGSGARNRSDHGTL